MAFDEATTFKELLDGMETSENYFLSSAMELTKVGAEEAATIYLAKAETLRHVRDALIPLVVEKNHDAALIERDLVVTWLKAEVVRAWKRYELGDRHMAGHGLEDAAAAITRGDHCPLTPQPASESTKMKAGSD